MCDQMDPQGPPARNLNTPKAKQTWNHYEIVNELVRGLFGEIPPVFLLQV